MTGFSPTQQALNVQNGNQVAVLLGDQVIMFAQTVGHQLPMGAEQLFGIGTQKPQEVQQLRMSPQFSLDSFALTAAGTALLQNGTKLEYILAGNQFDMHVIDNQNNVLFTYVGAKAGNFGQNLPANAPVRNSFSFLAMDVLNPQGQSIMDDGQNAIAVASSAASTVAAAAGGGIGLTV